jgi:mono/diheme cytochrome c family protein
MMKSITKRMSLVAALSLITSISVSAQDGEELFKTRCTACHSVGAKRLVGPGLAGINDKRTQEWLVTWIKDSQAMIASGDADAVAIFEEYNKSPMIPFADLSDAEIISMLDYIKGENSGGDATASTEEAAEPVADVEYTEEDFEAGKLLFTGKTRFENDGPSCIVCHNVKNDDVMVGGLLAKDLTNVYDRLGDAGVSGIVNAPPFPAMANSYSNNPLTESEVKQLTGFFKYANEVSDTQKAKGGYALFAGGGILGLIIILGLVSILWSNRKKESTKKDIFSRQLKGNDSVES